MEFSACALANRTIDVTLRLAYGLDPVAQHAPDSKALTPSRNKKQSGDSFPLVIALFIAASIVQPPCPRNLEGCAASTVARVQRRSCGEECTHGISMALSARLHESGVSVSILNVDVSTKLCQRAYTLRMP